MKLHQAAFAVVGACAAALAADPGAHAAGGASTCDRQIVMQIDSAKVTPGPNGFTITAFGTSESAGWKNPTLVASGAIADGSATVDFVACRPEVSAQVLTPIQAYETLKLDPATRRIVIRARTNSMTIDISHN